MKTLQKVAAFGALALMPYSAGITQSSKEMIESDRKLAAHIKSYAPEHGFVPDEATAIAVANAVTIPVYGEKTIKSEQPLKADLKNGIWTVIGTLSCDHCDGGEVIVQISKQTGAILFMSHTQ